MPEPSVTVVDVTGKPAPVVTPDLKERSDKRMSNFLKSVERKETGVANSSKSSQPTGAPASGAAPVATPPAKPAEPVVPVATEPAKKPDEVADKGKQPAEPKPATVNWEEEAKRHQSRADKLAEQYKEYEGKKAIPDTEYAELVQAKERVDAFVADPTGFILKYTPQLAKQLQSAGDPIKMIEAEVSEFTDELNKQFKTQFGEDWRFSEAEALQPGNPSFRYKLAIEEKIADSRDKQRRYVEQQRDNLQKASQTKMSDIAKLKQEFGFTDEDIKQAETNLENIQTNYYNMYRLALIDKIIEKKLSLLPNAPRPAPDLSQSPASREPAAPKPVELNADTKRVLSRMGVRSLNRV